MRRKSYPLVAFRFPACILALLIASPASANKALLDNILDIQAHQNISAVAYCIVSPDAVLDMQLHGHHSHAQNIPLSQDSVIRIGSISKTFLGLAALIVANTKRLTLTDPVTAYLSPPPYDNQWAAAHPVRIDQLLEHSAGLRDMSKAEFDFNEPVSLADAFAVDPQSRRLAWPPGKHSSYSNSGAGIVAAVIEAATGESYENYVNRTVFEPLGLASARFTPPSDPATDLVAGYDSDGTSKIPYWHQLYRAFGAINITVADMAKFVQFFLKRGSTPNGPVLPAELVDRMERPHTTLAARAGLGYGYGLGVYQFQRNGISFFGHGGDADGYLSFFAYSLELERGYFIVVNAFNGRALKKMRRLIEDQLTAEHSVDYPQTYTLTQEQRSRLAGRYVSVTSRFGAAAGTTANKHLDITVSDDGLYTSIDGGKTSLLVPVSARHFRRPWQSVATVAFALDGDKLIVQGDFGNYMKTAR